MGVPPEALLSAKIRSIVRIKSARICRSAGFSASERLDIQQQLMSALVKKAHLYDPSRGASFVTWASRVLDKEGLMIIRARHRLKRAAGYHARSMESGSVVVAGRAVPVRNLVANDRPGEDPAAVAEAGDTTRAVHRALPSFPPKLLKLAKLLMTGTPAAAARSLGISRRELYANMAEIRRRFKRAGIDGSA